MGGGGVAWTNIAAWGLFYVSSYNPNGILGDIHWVSLISLTERTFAAPERRCGETGGGSSSEETQRRLLAPELHKQLTHSSEPTENRLLARFGSGPSDLM